VASPPLPSVIFPSFASMDAVMPGWRRPRRLRSHAPAYYPRQPAVSFCLIAADAEGGVGGLSCLTSTTASSMTTVPAMAWYSSIAGTSPGPFTFSVGTTDPRALPTCNGYN